MTYVTLPSSIALCFIIFVMMNTSSNLFSSQTSGLGLDMAQDSRVVPVETCMSNESKQLHETVESKAVDHFSDAQNGIQDAATDLWKKVETVVPGIVQSLAPSTRSKKQTGKNAQTSGLSPPSSVFKSTELLKNNKFQNKKRSCLSLHTSTNGHTFQI